MNIIDETAYIKGYIAAVDDVLAAMAITEAYEEIHEEIRQKKLKPIKDALKKLSIKYKNRKEINDAIQIISKWASKNTLAISIQTYGALSYLLKMSFDNDEILLTLAAILTLSLPLSIISKKIIEYAEEVEAENSNN